jgi:hypothetical protein
VRFIACTIKERLGQNLKEGLLRIAEMLPLGAEDLEEFWSNSAAVLSIVSRQKLPDDPEIRHAGREEFPYLK